MSQSLGLQSAFCFIPPPPPPHPYARVYVSSLHGICALKRRFYYFCYSGISLFTRQLAWPQPETAMELLTRWDPSPPPHPTPPFKAILFFIFLSGVGGGGMEVEEEKKSSNTSTELLTFWFICYRQQKKSMRSDSKSRTDSMKTSCVKVSNRIAPQAVGYLRIDIFSFLIA